MPAGGYFGQALVVDVTSGTSRNQPLPDSVLRGYIGGAGLGTWLLCQLGTAGADPLGPRAPLAFVFSPLVGTPLTTSAKFAVVAKSPLTGMLTDALASSQFAIAEADRPRRDRDPRPGTGTLRPARRRRRDPAHRRGAPDGHDRG
jgi:Aldehyde:ferredoxin oxidoreductase